MKHALWSLGLIVAVMLAIAMAPSAMTPTAISQEQKPAAVPRGEQAKPAKAPASADEQAIRATANAFVKAFNSGEAQALGALWTADADYTDENGRTYHGRPAIEKEYAELFKEHPTMTIELDIQSLRVLNPTTALEDGRSAIVAQGQTISQARYTAVHVKENGKWLLSAVRDMPDTSDASFLALNFFVGDWVAHGETVSVKTSCKWTVGKKFLLRTFTVTSRVDEAPEKKEPSEKKETSEKSGLQIIGFDPATRQIRSWTFDSTGGHGQGLWTAVDGGWAIESQGVLPDGTPTASTDLIERVNENITGWQSVNRTAGGQQLPDTEQVVLERVEPRS